MQGRERPASLGSMLMHSIFAVAAAGLFPSLTLAQGGPPRTGLAPAESTSTPAAGQGRGVLRALEGAGTGATLVAPLRSKTTFLVDAGGETLHSWPSEWTPGNSAYLLEDGSLLRCGKDAGSAPFRGGGEGGRIQRISWDGELLWDHQLANSRRRQHHDIEPLPNGNVLAIVWEGVSAEDAMAAGRDAEGASSPLWPDAIVELRPVGTSEAEVVWEWRAWDHLVQDRDREKPNYGDPAEHPHRINVNFDRRERPKTAGELEREAAEQERLRGLGYGGGGDEPRRGRRGRGGRGGRGGGSDWMHTNGIDYDPATDLIAISVRSASEVWIIDHSTSSAQARTGEGGRRGRGGDLLYRFGRPASWGGSGEQVLFHQHDPQFLPAAEGLSLSVFNNGSGREGGDRSSADVFSIGFTEEGGFGDGLPIAPDLAWTWSGGEERIFNGHISGAQRLESGHMLVCLGEEGRVLEVTPDHRVVWEYLQDFEPDQAGDPGGPGGPRGRGGPPQGRPDRGGPPGAGPGGGPPRGGPPGGRRGGGGPQSSHAVFRATRYEAGHPGLARLSAAGESQDPTRDR